MFTKVFVILALAFVASAYHQIPYEGLDVPVSEKYEGYYPYQGLIKPVEGSSYYPGYYKYPYYTPEETGYVAPEKEYFGSYPYVSSWLKYPYYAKYFQKYFPISSYYQGEDIPSYYGKSFGYPYTYGSYPYNYGSYPYSYGSYPYTYGSYPYSYGSSPLWSKILGGSYYGYGSKYYTGVPEYPVY